MRWLFSVFGLVGFLILVIVKTSLGSGCLQLLVEQVEHRVQQGFVLDARVGLAFLGLLTGTYVSAITGDTAVPLMGMQVYSVQYTTLMRAVILLVMGIVLMKHWRAFTPDADVARYEQDAAARKRRKMRMHV